MHVTNTLTEYGIISKLLHWLSAILLLIQIPLGFYLVDLPPERSARILRGEEQPDE